MLNYEKFRDELIETLTLKGYSVEAVKVPKANRGYIEGLRLADADRSPLIHVKPLYDEYVSGADFFELTEYVIENFAGYERTPEGQAALNISIKDVLDLPEKPLCCMLINRRDNEEILKCMPHRDFLDMSVIYYLDLSSSGFFGELKVSNNIMEQMGLSEPEMFKVASTNMMFSARCHNLMDVALMKDNPTNYLSTGYIPDYATYLVLTGENAINGAGMLTNKNIMNRIADLCGDNLYLIPSSLHEIIIMRADEIGGSPQFLQDIVKGMNMNVLSEAERLSGSVYYYDRSDRSLSIALPEYEEDRNLKVYFADRGIDKAAIEQAEQIDIDPSDLRASGPRRDPGAEPTSLPDSGPDESRSHYRSVEQEY